MLFQAGSSSRGQQFAATHAEGVFVHGTRPEVIAPVVANVRARAAALGRDPRSVKAVTTIVAGATDAEAQAKYAELLSYADEGRWCSSPGRSASTSRNSTPTSP